MVYCSSPWSRLLEYSNRYATEVLLGNALNYKVLRMQQVFEQSAYLPQCERTMYNRCA
jgi:hypothetical protein